MSPLSKDARRKRATGEAAEWMVRLNAPSASMRDRAEFSEWLRESPLHVAEMLRITNLEAVLREHRGWDSLEPTRDFPMGEVISLPTEHRPSRRSPRQHRRIVGFAAAAAVALVFLAAGVTWVVRRGDGTTIHTQSGERREQVLADGSRVYADPKTDLTIQLTEKRRFVTLQQGSAIFHVAKDPRRPFVVNAMGAEVTAVGTIFRVSRSDDEVTVQVTEGKVMVEQPESIPRGRGTRGAGPIALVAHQEVVVTPRGIISQGPGEGLRASSTGTSVSLAFENETLGNLVSRFNRANRLQLRLTDDKLASTQVSGVFNLTDPQSFVAFLESTGHARAIYLKPDEIVLQPGGP